MLKKLNQFTEGHGALSPGRGLVTGAIALSLAILCFLGVLAFHFPQYLTTPELRKSYDVAVIRQLLFWSLVIAGALSLVNLVFRRNNFMKRDRVLTAQVLASNTNRDAFEARTFLVGASLERQTNLIFQKKWTWSVGAELVLSDERDSRARIVGGARRTFFIAALPTSLTYDGSDDLLNPTRGFRLGGRLSPEYSLQSGSKGYVRIQIDGSYYQPVSDRIVMAGRVRAATIQGAAAEDIAPARRRYGGGGASVRGYGFQKAGPRDRYDDPVGGRQVSARIGKFGPLVQMGTVEAERWVHRSPG